MINITVFLVTSEELFSTKSKYRSYDFEGYMLLCIRYYIWIEHDFLYTCGSKMVHPHGLGIPKNPSLSSLHAFIFILAEIRRGQNDKLHHFSDNGQYMQCPKWSSILVCSYMFD